MRKSCRFASTIDFAAFLTDPRHAEWGEFRDHYVSCPVCTQALVEWTQLETALRSLSPTQTPIHPLAEADERQFTESFDFSLIDEDSLEPADVPVREKGELSRVFTAAIQSLRGFTPSQLFAPFRQFVLHPAFAYTMVCLLSIPALRYFTLSHTQDELLRSSGPLRSIQADFSTAPLPHSADISPTNESADIVTAVLNRYKTAYEARDLSALERIWSLEPESRRELDQLFQDTRGLSLLVSLQAVHPSDDKKTIFVEFSQVTTLLRGEENYSARGPFFYEAELRRDDHTGEWVLQNIQELPS